MDKLNKLFKIAEENNIPIEYVRFPKYIGGIYYSEEGIVAIGINKNYMNNEKELLCILAEELGHHYTSVGDTTECYCYMDRIVLNKTELLAMKWAVNAVLTKEEIVQAFKRSNNFDECADLLNITIEFLYKAIKIFNINIPGYDISFEEFM